MGWAVGLWNTIAAPFRKSGAASPEAWFSEWARGGAEASAAGVSVTPETAMRTAAVWACVRVRSEDIGKLPCLLYRRLPGGGKERADTHPLYRLIRDQPNPRMTAFEFRQLMQAQLDLRGNAYALKEYDARGQITALWPLDPAKVTVFRGADGREIFYRVTRMDNTQVMMGEEEILHLRGLTLNGYTGLSPIAYHRETIGTAIAAERYGAAFYGNNAQPMGALKVPTVLSQEARDMLRKSWKERHLGKRELAILDGGLEWQATALSQEDAQYIDTLKLKNRDIWRIFRMPPHKVGDLENATFSNIEQQALEYISDCLLSETTRWEQTLSRDLLSDAEKKTLFFEFLFESLLRGDFKSRMEGYAIARNWGIFSADDVRERENMNMLPDSKGKIYLQPLNMIEAGTKPPAPAPPALPKPDPANPPADPPAA